MLYLSPCQETFNKEGKQGECMCCQLFNIGHLLLNCGKVLEFKCYTLVLFCYW